MEGARPGDSVRVWVMDSQLLRWQQWSWWTHDWVNVFSVVMVCVFLLVLVGRVLLWLWWVCGFFNGFVVVFFYGFFMVFFRFMVSFLWVCGWLLVVDLHQSGFPVEDVVEGGLLWTANGGWWWCWILLAVWWPVDCKNNNNNKIISKNITTN